MAVLFCDWSSALAAAPVLVQGFEKASTTPKLWVVNIPNENAAIELSTDRAAEGKQSLKLHYHFTGDGQYLGVEVPVRIKAPAQKLRFKLFGDNSGCGSGLYILDASGETHKFRAVDQMKVDFVGWKELTVDLDGEHETWGGDKNGKIDLPITRVTFEISTPGKESEGDLYFDAVTVESDKSAAEILGGEVAVTSPAYCADIQGDTTIRVNGLGFKTLTARCWKQGAPGSNRFGKQSVVAEVKLDDKGNGSFVFPADQYPHGPVTLTISGDNGTTTDNCYLQLYNKGGVAWNEGMPKEAPPAAKGLKLVFADDFTGPLSIGDGANFTYYDHKPIGGRTDFSFPLPFTSHDRPNTPFAQVDTYLRIRASEKEKSAGLISSLRNDGSGVKATVPCYFECRFIGPNAVGAWPAFWLMTDHITPGTAEGGCDELDIIEAYGGEGPGSPNSKDKYMVTPHVWGQDNDAEAQAAAKKAWAGYDGWNMVHMNKLGIPSTWYESPHTYGCLVTATETIYYCDDIEVGRHATLPLSKKMPIFFMVNMGTGGGWPVDLSRYAGLADMYVDYVRVYAGDGRTADAPAPRPAATQAVVAPTPAPVAATPAVVPAAPSPVSDGDIANGNFEAPALNGGAFTYTPDESGWTFTGLAGIQSNGSAYSGSVAIAPEGTQTAFLQGSAGEDSLGAMSQTVKLPAGTYALTLQAAQRWQQIQPVKVSVDGKEVDTITPTSDDFAQYTTAGFTVAAGQHEIRLEATDKTADKTTFIDVISLGKAAAAASKAE